jgi:hypothetical protein
MNIEKALRSLLKGTGGPGDTSKTLNPGQALFKRLLSFLKGRYPATLPHPGFFLSRRDASRGRASPSGTPNPWNININNFKVYMNIYIYGKEKPGPEVKNILLGENKKIPGHETRRMIHPGFEFKRQDDEPGHRLTINNKPFIYDRGAFREVREDIFERKNYARGRKS